MLKDNNSTFNRIFSNICDKDIIKISNSINIKKSKDIVVSGNVFNTNIIFNGFYKSDIKDNQQNIYIDFKDSMSEDKTQRAIFNIEYMDKFIFECNRQGVCPIFRYYGLFSHLSSLRCETDYSEYNQLILEEKKAFEKMLYLNYKIKLIISLDIPIIVTKWGYTLDETKCRIENLCNNVDVLTKNHNIEIVIDEKNSMDGMYILDKCVLIRAINIDPEKKYNITKYETNPYVINNIVQEFDEKFQYLRFQNDIVRRTLKIDSYSVLIQKIVEGNMEFYYELLNKENI